MVDSVQSRKRNSWFKEDGVDAAIDLLMLPSFYGEAEKQMHGGVRSGIGLGQDDLSALRWIIDCHQSGTVVLQQDIAAALGISDASASALVDRLCEQGHVQRVEHPSERRSAAVVPTPGAIQAAREIVGFMPGKLMEVASSFTEQEAEILKKFFLEMIQVMEQERAQRGTLPTMQPAPSGVGGF